MNFAIEKVEENGYETIYMKDTIIGTRVGIVPALGAMLHHFSINSEGISLNIIDSYRNEEEIKKALKLAYKSAKLSPFVCRIEKGRYEYNGKKYEFAQKFKDGSAIHGLLADKAFLECECFVTENNACISLCYDYDGSDPGYPFKYSCKVMYTLHGENKLDITTTLESHEEKPIPIADGWHPYFSLGETADDWTLQFSSVKRLVFTESLIPSGEISEDHRFLNGISLKGIKLDNCFILERNESGSPDCILSNPATGHEIRFFAKSGYPFLQIYIPEDRKSVAIENLSGAPDCFNNKMGLINLQGKVSFSVQIEVS